MKDILIIITVFVIMAMIFCTQMKYQRDLEELENEKTYWKSLFLTLLKKYRALKNGDK